MTENPAPHHADPRPSEYAAAVLVAPLLKKMKKEIYYAVLAEKGLTPDEYQAKTGGLINTIRRRFTDLWKEGYIMPIKAERKNRRGNMETVFVVGRDANVRVRAKGKPVELDIECSEGGFGGNGDWVRVVVMVPKEAWERVPSPARVRFI